MLGRVRGPGHRRGPISRRRGAPHPRLQPPGHTLIIRQHTAGAIRSEARYSPCEAYRYSLTRTWDNAGRRLLYIMLNPSRATEVDNDPTIERCQRRAEALGFGAFCAANIFALRETDPHIMRRHADPAGPDNDTALRDILTTWLRPEDMVLAAWGTHGAHLNRGPQIAALLHGMGRPIHTLGLSKHGHPRHPLYISYATQPILWPIP